MNNDAQTNVPEISVQELDALLKAKADVLILDVRNPDEYAICHLGGYLLPLPELPLRYTELNPNQQIVVHCRSGGRSKRAAAFLLEQGFNQVSNLRGGITAWANEIDTNMPKY